jgi:hypothetical protein
MRVHSRSIMLMAGCEMSSAEAAVVTEPWRQTARMTSSCRKVNDIRLAYIELSHMG